MTTPAPWGGEAAPAIDLSLDLRGEVCPHPVMLTLEQLNAMQRGQVLQVIVDCPSAFVNIPVEIDRHGHALLQEPLRRGADAIMLIRRGGVPPARSRETAETCRSRQTGLSPRLA